MRRMKREVDGRRWGGFIPCVAIVMLMTGGVCGRAMAQEKGQKTFSSAEDASEAFWKASQSNDEKALIEIIGPSAKEIISSGDDAQDAKHRMNFVKRYEEMHRLFKEPDGTTTLYVGAQNWPLPIPLVNKGEVWYFDGAAAKQEILFRRVGRNEISAIRVLQELAAAQKEYFTAQQVYAAKIMSEAGQKDGLYWQVGEDQPKCPIGPRVAFADAGSVSGAKLEPFRGYYFRVLTAQGKDAPGGAKSYMEDGKMKGGFAFIAYPVEYRSSGVMTFVAGNDGAVYEKDLGKKTESEAKAMKAYDPDSTWHKAQYEQDAMNTQATK
ncbi:MAG TPA: DUF2950 domain-containing protein [Candidatus Acidoferrum sp.]|nr:DUF2950 domain-containing protein [Candidatus Acidoferrum sp.]